MIYYIETSALLRSVLREAGYQEFKAKIEAAKIRVSSVLTMMEARRALNRLLNTGTLTEKDQRQLQGFIARLSSGWDLLEITPDVQERVGNGFPIEPVRTLDAIHLASALEFSRIYPDLRVMTSDERISANLEPLGLLEV